MVLTPPRLNRPLTLDRTRPTAAISMAVQAEKRKGDEARCQARGGGNYHLREGGGLDAGGWLEQVATTVREPRSSLT